MNGQQAKLARRAAGFSPSDEREYQMLEGSLRNKALRTPVGFDTDGGLKYDEEVYQTYTLVCAKRSFYQAAKRALKLYP